ncbi:hypothetical protein [Pseudomonas sp. MWU13-2105]|uniref:hypothetical protein n=1 Tax=Pseudomonas sp. MWU13-2105 TaxID=2935074 RepID=UPI00200E8C23|nr:hypothetical protein [Pseudomonas sp. MWU13-2105]
MTMIDAELLKPYLTEADNARVAWRTTVAALSKSRKDALEEGVNAVKIAERTYYRCCEELANALRDEIARAQ